MKPQNLRPLNPQPHRDRYSALFVAGSLVLALGLGACSKQDESKSAGQQVDSAIAKGEQAAAEARAKTEESAAKAKVKVESAMADAGAALKSASAGAETTARDVAARIEGKIDDVSITTLVSAAIGKESDLSVVKINVDTKNGAVTLNGSAPTEVAREKAGNIARAVKGVNSVDNKLVVKAS